MAESLMENHAEVIAIRWADYTIDSPSESMKWRVDGRVDYLSGCHGFGVFDKAVRSKEWLIKQHGLVEDSETVAPQVEQLKWHVVDDGLHISESQDSLLRRFRCGQ